MNTERLVGFLNKEQIEYKADEPMCRHTSFKIGGNADFFICPKNQNELTRSVRFCKDAEIPMFLIGNGSNILVSDDGIRGAVISLCKMSDIAKDRDTLICDGGASLASVCLAAQKSGLSGLEFAYGIPASVGGAVYMNAGAYGGEIKDVIISADVLTDDGKVKTFTKDEMELTYRNSIFKKNNAIILSAKFKLKPSDSDKIKFDMSVIIEKRKSKQPLEYPSAGSTFKRPTGHFAAALIEEAGLKGESVGDAQVSKKHSGFIINIGNATANDVNLLIEKVKNRVFENSGVLLEEEIIRL